MRNLHKFATKALRQLPAERAHEVTIRALKSGLGPQESLQADPDMQVTVGGLTLPNPVGLAAGFDKNAEVPDAMLRAGFGFVECGTVTPRPQAGNEKPRLFRLPDDHAVINRMGFNNDGLDAFRQQISSRAQPGIVGANLGANKDSQDRVEDYVMGLTRLWGLVDYFTINISSPNTPGLRQLQEENAMDDLLTRVSEARASLTGDTPSTPIFLKVSPDIDFNMVERITEQARMYGLNAIIVSNTTLDRPNSLAGANKSESGGLSGRPLFEKSTELLKEFAAVANGRIDLIGVGGISSGADAYAKIKAGAKAVQIYTAMVYAGPALVMDIRKDLKARMKADGFSSLSELTASHAGK